MGQGQSGQTRRCGRRGMNTDPVVSIDKVSGRGSLPVTCRYTTSRTLESDFNIEPRVLGSGMSGPVRLATARADGQKYAVKSFKKTGLSARRRAELKSEAEIYLSLDHPHVARLEMVYETEEDLHLVMEYMAGGEMYDRLAKKKHYTEEAAAEAVRQMLLAVSYLHAHRIAHRDLKLENFLYMSQDSDHLKIIDFGFAKSTEASTTMSQACGSIHYVAPEVLKKSYTEKADMWSLGIIAYMLLTGAPPFFGTDEEVLKKIPIGDIHWSSRYHRLSPRAKHFVQSLLVVNPDKRLSAQQALEHPWIKERNRAQERVLDMSTLDSLRNFAQASLFRRNVLSMMAWSLTSEDRNELRSKFLSIDREKKGTIALADFKALLSEQFDVCEAEAEEMFQCLDTDKNHEIEYTEFLAAALIGQLKVHGDVLRKTFSRFDRDGNGKIDMQELKLVLGKTFSNKEMHDLMLEADTSGDGKLDYEEFMAYFQKTESNDELRSKKRVQTEKLGQVIDDLLVEPSASTPPSAATSSSGSSGDKVDVKMSETSTCSSEKSWFRPKVSFMGGRTSQRNPLPTLLKNIRTGWRSELS